MKNIKNKQELDIAWTSKGVLTKRNDVRIGRIRQLQHRQPRDQLSSLRYEICRILIAFLLNKIDFHSADAMASLSLCELIALPLSTLGYYAVT